MNPTRAFVLTAVLAASIVPVASAQTRSASVGVGYQVLHIPDETYPIGVTVDVDAPIGEAFLSVVAAAGYARDQQTEARVGGLLEFWDFGAGLRFTARTSVRPYVQLIVGGVHTNAHLIYQGTVPFRDSDTVFMLQPGFGVASSGRVAVFGQIDYRRAFFDNGSGTGENEFRGIVGIKIGRP